MNSDTRRTLEALKSGEITVDEAMLAITLRSEATGKSEVYWK